MNYYNTYTINSLSDNILILKLLENNIKVGSYVSYKNIDSFFFISLNDTRYFIADKLHGRYTQII